MLLHLMESHQLVAELRRVSAAVRGRYTEVGALAGVNGLLTEAADTIERLSPPVILHIHPEVHQCRPPGAWKRWWLNAGTEWQCVTCGQWWALRRAR